MRFEKLLVAAVIAVAQAGCSDQPTAVNTGEARILFAPRLSYQGPTGTLPIERVRLTTTLHPDGTPLSSNEEDVAPTDPTFEVHAIVEMGSRDSALVDVRIEMLSFASGSEIVEWSGIAGPIMVQADATTSAEEEISLLRGPIENRHVESLSIQGPEFMQAGDSYPLHASVSTSGAGHKVLWTSSNEAVVAVDAAGDSVNAHALTAGEAMIIAAAGSKADTLFVVVDTLAVGAVAHVFAYPDSATVIVGNSRTWDGFATDSAGLPVAATLAWTSLDPAIATVDQSGVVTAEALGRTQIVVSANAFADTVVVHVQELPPGADLLWQGGTAGAEEDWFTADNWSPARVPDASSVIYLPGGAHPLYLSGNAEVGGILSDPLGFGWMDIGSSTLTSHGDVLISGAIFADSVAGRLVIDAASASISGTLPSLTLLGAISVAAGGAYSYGDVLIDSSLRPASLDVGDSLYAYVSGDLTLTGAHLRMGQDTANGYYSSVWVEGDLTIDGGDSRGHMTGGDLIVRGDFTVTAASCEALAPTGTVVYLYGDSSHVSTGCPSATGNHFWSLVVYDEGNVAERILQLDSDIVVVGEMYTASYNWLRMIGNGHTLSIHSGDLYWTELDRVFLEVSSADPNSYLYTDSVMVTGMTGETRPQLVYRHPGEPCECGIYLDIAFDSTSSGPYVHAIDTDASMPYLILAMEQNPGDGPARTVVDGGAEVHWAGVPYMIEYWSGDLQSGTQGQPLADSLAVEVRDYLYYEVQGATVEWAVTAGNGSVSPVSTLTDSLGIARTEYTVGDTLQASHEVVATSPAVPGDTVFFTAFAMAPGASPSMTSITHQDREAPPPILRRDRVAPRLPAKPSAAVRPELQVRPNTGERR